jgi:hypothetical protein
MLQRPDTELAFSGKVVRVARTAPAAYRATFEVERVSRGSVTRHFDLYVSEQATETPRFELSHEYVVFAHRLASATREAVGLKATDPGSFTAVNCSEGYPLKETIDELRPGEAPKESTGQQISPRVTPNGPVRRAATYSVGAST